MKKILLSIIIVLLAISLIAASLPPIFPSSFYGMVTGGNVGDVITASVDGEVRATASAVEWNGAVVYSINVPGESSDQDKDVTFAVNGVNILIVGNGWQSGTNKPVNLPAENYMDTSEDVEPAPNEADDAPTIEEPAQNIPAEESAPFIVETVTMTNGVQYQAIAGLMCFDVL